MFNTLKDFIIFLMIYHLYQKEWKLINVINKKIWKNYVIHIRALNQASNHGLVLEKCIG